jgi:hypothetical protein
MLEAARRNMDYADTIRVLNEDTGVFFFEEITKEDIKANGKIVPMGARHFAERAQRIQNITQLYQLKLADPAIAVEFARILADELGEPTLFAENVAILEQMQTEKMSIEAQVQLEEEQEIAIEKGL